MTTVSEWWMWPTFLAFVLVMIFIDLFLFNGRKVHHVSTGEALSWTIIWVCLALIFNLLFWRYLLHVTTAEVAYVKALEFTTGYLIEKSLSIDNIFVILMIFQYFSIPMEYQRRVLIYGVLGAIVMRLLLILLGIWVINQFHWVLYLFGLLLLVTGFKMFFVEEEAPELEMNPVYRMMNNYLYITKTFHGEHFFVLKDKVRYATPLFVGLVLVEVTDLIFAVDSIPAIFAITDDPFIVFTSNIFAILGLRALYFLLVNMHNRFHLLKYGLAVILILIGIKMLIAHWLKIPIFFTLGSVVIILFTSVMLSIYHSHLLDKRKKKDS